ncbi:DUF2500 domain-containing protein [Paenibacillus sp. N3.4]|uniref:DUF2500 domain-containing protein n=1 Tax=Paenibacillus sp. N3.4 TaxID=2603222 RepID=UPI0011C92640|nr:DUF2500 domain-containing protein [Paenibacillus sp. N3.4]TXK83912.1 DUF2500 domain-containing protein [Paenibacillus sp. N3.4]
MSTGFNTNPFSGGLLFGTIFTIIFLFIIGFILFMIIKGLITWSSNNASPIQSRNCKVVTKRMKVSGGSGESSSSSSYYITFEFEDRSRLELRVSNDQFGYIVEGDEGTLTNQGTRFKQFNRIIS